MGVHGEVVSEGAGPTIESVVAPWALPNEGLPLLFQWMPEDSISSVTMHVPNGFKVVRLLNGEKQGRDEDKSWEVKPLHPGFVGFHLVNTRSPDNVVDGSKCEVEFKVTSGETITRAYRLNTVRPRLELLSAPKEVLIESPSVEDHEKVSPVEISLRHTGLGFIQIQVKCTVKGLVVSQSDDVLRGLIRSISELETVPETTNRTIRDKRTVDGAKSAGLEVEIDPMSESEIEQIKHQVLNYLDTGVLSDELSSPEAINELRDFFSTVDPKILNDLVRDQVFNLYTRQLLEGMRRFPSDFSEIEGGPTRARLDSTMREMRVTLRYSDSQGNSYETIEVTLPITDRRADKNVVAVPLKLNIENKLIGEVPPTTWTP